MDYGKRPPLDEQKSLWEATVAAEGVTTDAGEGTGLSLDDAGLAGAGANSFVSMMAIIHPGDPTQVDSRDITEFNDGTGRITVASAFKGGQVAAGVPYKIVTFRFVPAEVAAIDAKIGTATDAGDLGTLFAKFKQQFVVDHARVLLIVADATSLDADMDTALKSELEDDGYIVDVAEPADIAGNLHLAFDFIVVSGSITADTNLTKLREAECPVITHSAEVAVSTNVFSLGATAGTEAAQTHIEIKDNTPVWLIDTALGDLEVTVSATLETMASVSGDVINLAEEKIATGNDITMAILRGGDNDGQGVQPSYDRVFVGVKDFTNANAVFKALMAALWEHLIHEKRVAEVVVTPKRVYQESIPDNDFDLAAIDDDLTADPPSADAENSIIDLDQRTNRTYVLRSLWVKTTDFGTTGGTKLTFALWVLVNGSVTKVDEVDVVSLGFQNLMDLFGLPEVHADGIWITVVTDATDEPGDAACEGSYRYAEARK